MGFDTACIVNIQTYPGEYFCPVCRTLVYPTEAFQSQCTHLYCKPCLAHVANTTKACPYDGYLVTEADAKPLIESDKALAENIGKVKVHCLYHRSGCAWEGTLSESSSHCSGCTSGNSLVICNRCGIQIVHRQVHDHAQTCPGAYQAPQAVDANQNAASSTVTASTTYMDQNHAVLSSGPYTSSQQANAGSQGASVAPSATPTPDQWYQQQYYQQYAGYNPYQQSYQQYYPYPQPVGQTYQQGQYNSQAYVQPHPQPQAQAQFQSYPAHQVPAQPQPQSQSQSQDKVTQPPVAVTGTNQLQSHVQSAGPHYQQVNPQQQFSSQQPHPQGNLALHSQPQPQQYAQETDYQQPVQSTHPAVPSQTNTQPPQSQNLLQPQIQPQQQLHQQSLPYSQQYPPQINQHPVPNAQPHASHPANAVVTGHQSYKPPQQIPMPPAQQHALPLHGHIPQQPPLAPPPLSHGIVTNQQKPAVPTPMPNNHSTQLQQLHPQAHPPAYLVQHHPGMQSIQQSMPQQSQAFHAHLQGTYSQLGQQQPLQSQLRPHGAPHVMQPGAHGYNSTQQNTPLVPGFIPQQPPNYGPQPPIPVGRGFGPTAQNKPVPFGSSHSSANINFVKRETDALEHLKDPNVTADSADLNAVNSGTQIKMEKESIEETRDGSGLSRIVVNDADKEVKKGVASEPVMLKPVKEERSGDFSDTPPAGKLLGVSAVKENIDTGGHKKLESFRNKNEAFAANRDSQSTNSSVSNANGSDKFVDPLKSQSLYSSGLRPQVPGVSPTSLKGPRPDHLPHHATISGFPGPSSVASHGRGRGIFGPPPRSFGLHSGAQSPSLPSLPHDSVDPRSGVIGPHGHGETGMDSSAFGLWDDRFNFRAGEHGNHFPMEQVRPFDQDGTAGPPRFMPPPLRPGIVPEREPQFGVPYDFSRKADPSHAADFPMHYPAYGINHGMPPHDREYIGMPLHELHAFGEGPRPFKLPPDSTGGSHPENMGPGLRSNMQKIERGSHRHNHLRNAPFEEELLPGLSRRGHMSGPQDFSGHFRSGDAAGFGTFPGGGRMGEMAGGFPHYLPGLESFRGNFSDFPRLGEHGFRSDYSCQGFADDRFYADDLVPFDKSRKRKPVSMGWCRICKIDCQSVEGLDMHSHAREHQRMALDMVKTIKQQNKKKNKMSGDRASTIGASKTRNSGFEGRGSKP